MNPVTERKQSVSPMAPLVASGGFEPPSRVGGPTPLLSWQIHQPWRQSQIRLSGGASVMGISLRNDLSGFLHLSLSLIGPRHRPQLGSCQRQRARLHPRRRRHHRRQWAPQCLRHRAPHGHAALHRTADHGLYPRRLGLHPRHFGELADPASK